MARVAVVRYSAQETGKLKPLASHALLRERSLSMRNHCLIICRVIQIQRQSHGTVRSDDCAAVFKIDRLGGIATGFRDKRWNRRLWPRDIGEGVILGGFPPVEFTELLHPPIAAMVISTTPATCTGLDLRITNISHSRR